MLICVRERERWGETKKREKQKDGHSNTYAYTPIHTPPFKYTCMHIYTNHTHSTLYILNVRVGYLHHQLLPVNNLRKRKKSLQYLSHLYLPYSHPTHPICSNGVCRQFRGTDESFGLFVRSRRTRVAFFLSPIPTTTTSRTGCSRVSATVFCLVDLLATCL